MTKRLWSEVGSKAENENEYKKYEHDGITIFIDKAIKVSAPVKIDLKSNLPLFGPSFTVKGVQ